MTLKTQRLGPLCLVHAADRRPLPLLPRSRNGRSGTHGGSSFPSAAAAAAAAGSISIKDHYGITPRYSPKCRALHIDQTHAASSQLQDVNRRINWEMKHRRAERPTLL